MRYQTALTLGLISLPIIALAQSSYQPPPQSSSLLSQIDFKKATPVDENYREQFDLCDQKNVFNGQKMPDERKCSDDPNKVKALLRFSNGTIFFESKLSLDLDGSWKACNEHGKTDQCDTWYEWTNSSNPQVDSDKYPYIVIPAFTFKNGRVVEDQEFRNKTGLNKGDVGVVVYRDKVVPVFVADGGPNNKLGEGSSALFKALGEDRCLQWRNDGHCARYRDTSISEEVLFFIFPKSEIQGIKPDNALTKVNKKALEKFQQLKK
jgi:hypothetical protein